MYSLLFYMCTQPSKMQVQFTAKCGDNTKKCQCVFWRAPCTKRPENLELHLVLLVVPRLRVACCCWVGKGLICQKMALLLHGAACEDRCIRTHPSCSCSSALVKALPQSCRLLVCQDHKGSFVPTWPEPGSQRYTPLPTLTSAARACWILHL